MPIPLSHKNVCLHGRQDPAAACLDRKPHLYMVQALLVCEAGHKRSTVYAASRFASTALHGLLGAAGPAATNFDALAIKHIQHDTITGEALGACRHRHIA